MFSVDSIVKARKYHRCFHCYQQIAPKTKYIKQFVTDYGTAWTIKMHEDCEKLFWFYIDDCNLRSYYDDELPPLYDDWMESDEICSMIDHYRGFYPHAITRIETTLRRYNPDGTDRRREK